jgi:RND superfamily putative drug exporter
VSRKRSFLFERWPRFAAQHPWYVLAGALVTVVGFVALHAVAGRRYKESFNIPGTESQRLFDLLPRLGKRTA